MTRDQLLDQITKHYLESTRFNGMGLGNVDRDLAAELIREGLVAAVFGDGHPNPHIRALSEHHSIEKQVELLKSENSRGCLYPLPKHLERVVDRSAYVGRPYTLELALGAPQLVHRAFDLSVLEPYRNDPQYDYYSDDIFGSLSVRDGSLLSAPHQVFLDHFGFAYDEDSNKYVAAFLWDLHRLSPEHQQLWKMREVKVETELHPDFYRAAILGEFPERVSIYQAFTEELQVINDMAGAMGRPALFREDYRKKSRPRPFASLLRPTLREFNEFVLILDQLVSDNMDKAFFKSEVPDVETITHDDGSIERRPIGTIRLLKDWLEHSFKTDDNEPIKRMLDAFRKVRQLRQKPAHKASDNEFDQSFIHRQRELMIEAYIGAKTLRLILANHPATKAIEVPEWLQTGMIWPR